MLSFVNSSNGKDASCSGLGNIVLFNRVCIIPWLLDGFSL